MGSASSLSSVRGISEATSNAAKTVTVTRREQQSPRRVFFCHSCKSFSYDSLPNRIRQLDSPPLLCPHPFCRPHPVIQLEEIPSTTEGSLRLQVIMLELIHSRAALRPRISCSAKVGVRTVDILLDIDMVNLDLISVEDQQICSICNDDFISSNNCRCRHTEEDQPSQELGMKLRCGHIFHQSCILSWFESHQTCPCCRTKVNRYEEIPAPDQLALRFSEEQLSSKIKFGLSTPSYLMAKEIEAFMISDKKEDYQLMKIRYTVDLPSRPLLCGQMKIEELSMRLYGLLLKVNPSKNE